MDSDLVQIHLTVPREWHDELKSVAELQAISLAALVRLIIRAFLRNRYSDLEREVLSR